MNCLYDSKPASDDPVEKAAVMSNPVEKAISAKAGTLTRELGVDCRPVFFTLDFNGDLRLTWPRKTPPKLTPAAEGLIALCLKKERSLLIESRSDPQLAGLGHGDFNSALAVPLFDTDKNAVGVIYTQHGVPELFNTEHRQLMEQAAWGLTRALPKKGVAKQPIKVVEQPKSRWSLRAVLLVSFLCSACAVLWLLAPQSKPLKVDLATTQLRRDLASDPTAVVSAFRSSLALRHFKQAYDMLHPDMQAKLPYEQFESRVSQWLTKASNRAELPLRPLIPGPTLEGKPSCLLQPVVGRSNGEIWEWVLCPANGQLRILEMRLGPLSEEEPRRPPL